MPVQAMVMIFGFSSLPQLTIVGATGASRVEPFQNTFAICLKLPFHNVLFSLPLYTIRLFLTRTRFIILAEVFILILSVIVF